MRQTNTLFLGLVFAIACCHPAWAWVEARALSKNETPSHGFWPPGLRELASRPGRVHGTYFIAHTWHKGFERCHFYFAGDSQAFNCFVNDYAALRQGDFSKDSPLLLILHPGKGEVQPLLAGDKATPSPDFDWKLSVFGLDVRSETPRARVELEVWVNDRMPLDRLEVPQDIQIKAIAPFDSFVRQHESKRLKGNAPALHHRVTELRRELDKAQRELDAAKAAVATAPAKLKTSAPDSMQAPASSQGVALETAPKSDEGRRIWGRVTDKDGKPLAGAGISAWSPAAGGLRDPAKTLGHTDELGRFDLAVEFGRVRYHVWITKAGYAWATVDVLAGQEDPIRVCLEPHPRHTLQGTIRRPENGNPVPDALVVLIPERGERREVRTNESGQFEIADLSKSIGQGVIYAAADGLISPFQIVKGHDREVSLELGQPSSLEGQIVEQGSGRGASDCQVILRTLVWSSLPLKTRSGHDGKYSFTGIPPGRYQVRASRDDLYQVYEAGVNRPYLRLEAGKSGTHSIELRRKTRVEGRVLTVDGQPAGGVAVSVPAGHSMHGGKLWSLTRTDPQGRFSLLAAVVHREYVFAFLPRLGCGHATIQAGEETPNKVTIKLSGGMRVRGIVTDEKRKPVECVRVSGSPGGRRGIDVTNKQGRFDLGWIRLTVEPGQDQPIYFRCPRPHRGDPPFVQLVGHAAQQAREPAPGERFFLDKKVLVRAEPGGHADLFVKLQPTQLVTLTGQVRDAVRRLVPGAHVILFAGNAHPTSWKDDLHPMRLVGSSIARFVEETNAPLIRTVSDADGRWAIWTVRETKESLEVAFSDRQVEFGVYSVGAEGPDGGAVLVRGVRLEEGRSTIEIDLPLGHPLPKRAR